MTVEADTREAAFDSPEVAALRRVLRNGLALLFAYLLPRAFTFASVVVAARYLGASDFGSYGTAAAFAVILSIVATLGMVPLLVREIARDPERAPGLLRAAHWIKTASNAVMLVALVALSDVLGFDEPVARAALLLGVGYALGAYAENMSAYFQAIERMHVWTQASAAFGLVSGAAGIAIVLTTRDLVWFCAAPALGWSAGLAWLLWRAPETVRRGTPVRRDEVLSLLRALLPFAVAFVILTVYYKVDVLLLARWRPPTDVGVYAAAYKFVDIFQALAIVAAAAVYPRLSRAAAARRVGEEWAGGRSSELMLMAGALAGGGLHLLAEPVVLGLYGEAYAPSVVIARTLALVLPLLGLTILGGYVLAAAERMVVVAALYGVGLFVNVGLNTLLIPARAGEGAALAMLGSEVLLVVGVVAALRHFAHAAPRARVLVAAAAALGLSIALLALDPTGGYVGVLIFVAAAPAAFWLMRCVTPEDVALVRSAIRPERGDRA